MGNVSKSEGGDKWPYPGKIIYSAEGPVGMCLYMENNQWFLLNLGAKQMHGTKQMHVYCDWQDLEVLFLKKTCNIWEKALEDNL